MGIFDAFGNVLGGIGGVLGDNKNTQENKNTTSSGTQSSFGTSLNNTTQQGLSDVTSKGTPYLEAGLGNVLGQLGTFGASPFQTAAGYNLAGLGSGATLGTAFGTANNVAQGGIGDPSRYMSPYLSSVVNPTLQAQNIQNQQALQNIRGNQASRGALGNNTGNRAEAVYYQGALPQQTAAIAISTIRAGTSRGNCPRRTRKRDLRVPRRQVASRARWAASTPGLAAWDRPAP